MNACYRKLRNWKYQLTKEYRHDVGIEGLDVVTDFVSLRRGGTLVIAAAYAWDGPSGPTIDTLNFMRGSLVHDALYQLMRTGHLPVSYRDRVDQLFRRMCKEDGMSSLRAWYVYKSVRWFGATHAEPGTEPPVKIVCLPRDL